MRGGSSMSIFVHPHDFVHTFSLAERMILSNSFQERIVQELKEVGIEMSHDDVFRVILQMYKVHHKIRVASDCRNYEFLHALGDTLHIFQLKELEQIKAGIDPEDSIIDLIGWRILDTVRMVMAFDRKVYDSLFWEMADYRE